MKQLSHKLLFVVSIFFMVSCSSTKEVSKSKKGATVAAKNQSGIRNPYLKATAVNTSQSDIRALVRAELKSLRSQLRSARGADSMSRIHIADALERIDAILNPNG